MPVKSANRSLQIFELFAAEQTPLSVTDISQAMKIPQSSASMLVKSLVGLGYLEHNLKTRTYYPTFRIALLGTWMSRRHEQAGRLPKLAADLAKTTGETVILAMRNSIFAQYALVQLGPDPLRLHVESGMQRPLACCASGWALLSNEKDREIEKIVTRTKAEAEKPQWRKSAQEAYKKIAQVRQKGYVMSNGQTTSGAGSIALLLPASAGHARLSAAVGGPIERIKSKRDFIVQHLQEMSLQVISQPISTESD